MKEPEHFCITCKRRWRCTGRCTGGVLECPECGHYPVGGWEVVDDFLEFVKETRANAGIEEKVDEQQ